MTKLKLTAKAMYVKAIRVLQYGLDRIGVLRWLDGKLDRRGFHWLRSLLAIYDVDQMIALDVPWWTYDAIDRVDAFLSARPDAKVFEYGSGASTVWLARRCASVVSIEHDANWFNLMQSRVAEYSGVDLRLVPQDADMSAEPLFHSKKEGYLGSSFEAYVRAITVEGARFDLIVVDGRSRAACLAFAEQHLAEDGLIVFDNSKRRRYVEAIEASPLTAKHLPGLTPALPYPDRTTLLQASSPSGARG